MRYAEIAGALTRRIRRGEYAAGGRLPSVSALARELAASRGAVTRALEEIEQVGWVSRCDGRWQVLQPAQVGGFDLLQPLATWARANGMEPTACTVEGRVDRATGTEARALRVPVGSQVVRLTRWQALDGRRVLLVRAVLLGRFAPVLLRLPTGTSSVIEELQRRGHLVLGPAEHRVSAVAATTSDAELLGVPRASPLVRVLRTARTRAGEVYEHSEFRFVPDAVDLRVDTAAPALAPVVRHVGRPTARDVPAVDGCQVS